MMADHFGSLPGRSSTLDIYGAYKSIRRWYSLTLWITYFTAMLLGGLSTAWAIPAGDFSGAWIADVDQSKSNVFANVINALNPFSAPEIFLFEKGHIFVFGAIIGPGKVFRIDSLTNDGRTMEASYDPAVDYHGNRVTPPPGSRIPIRIVASLDANRTGMTILWKEGVEERQLVATLAEGQRIALQQISELKAQINQLRSQAVERSPSVDTTDSCPIQTEGSQQLANLRQQLASCKERLILIPANVPQPSGSVPASCPAPRPGVVIDIRNATVVGGGSRVELHTQHGQEAILNIVGRVALAGPNLRVMVNGQLAELFGKCGDFSAAVANSEATKELHVEADSGDGRSAKLTVYIVR